MPNAGQIARSPAVPRADSYFDARAATYGQQSAWVHDRDVAQTAVDLLAPSPLGDVCDAGGGTGALARVLMESLSYTTMTIVDESAAMLERAPQGVHVQQIQLEQMADEDAFDTLLLRQVLHYLREPRRVLSRLHTSLRDDGRMYVGQIVAPNGAAARWMAGVAQQVSVTRRRVYTVDKLLTALAAAGFRLTGASLDSYSDDVHSLASRSIYAPDHHKLVNYARGHATASLTRALRLDLESETLPFDLLWFHGVFSR